MDILSTSHVIKVTYTYRTVSFSWVGWPSADGRRVTRRIPRGYEDLSELREIAVAKYLEWLDAGPDNGFDWPKYKRTVRSAMSGEMDRNTDVILLQLNIEPAEDK